MPDTPVRDRPGGWAVGCTSLPSAVARSTGRRYVSTRRKPRRKAGGRVPTATARRVGRSELLHGWVGPHGYRVRFARPGEGSAVGELLERAEVEFDAQMIEEIDGTAMGTSLRLGVEFGKKAMLRAVAANSVHLAD